MVLLNGKPTLAPVTRSVIEALAPAPVKVSTDLEMPQGSGFGASGAGALGASYAINSLFNLGFTSDRLGEVAHVAEVMNGTGLGDVIAQNTGGLLIRLEPGAPGIGRVDRILVPPTEVDCVVRGPISTKEVLSDPGLVRQIACAGEEALDEIVRRPTFERFMELSRRFSIDSGLAQGWILDAIEAVEALGGLASMIMLGDAVFAVGGREALSEFGPVITTRMTERGASLD